MLSRLARLALVLELLAYIGIGAWLHGRHALNPAILVAAAFTTALALRLGFVAASMVLSALAASAHSREHPIGAPGLLRLLAEEYRAVLASNFFSIPFEHLVMPSEREPQPTDRLPVVLVHGFFGNRGYFRRLKRRLEDQGITPVFSPNFSATFAHIERFSAELDSEIERVCAGTGRPQVVLVCHSMGGLAARRYIASRGAARVAKLITLATPHAGTALARLGLGQNAVQMRRGSVFLRELQQAEAASAGRYATTSIYSPHDNLVSPHETSRLDWAENIPIPGLGHITILISARAFDVLLEALRKGGVRVER